LLPIVIGGSVIVTIAAVAVVLVVLVATGGDDVAPTAAPHAATDSADGGSQGAGGSSAASPSSAPSTAGATTARGPTIRAGGDLDFQPSPAGPATTAGGLSASFELSFTAEGATVHLAWPAQNPAAFDHYTVLRRAPPSQPEEVAVAALSDRAATTFSQDLGTAVAPDTTTVAFRLAMVDAGGTTVRVSTTLTLQLG
jgi:hypothetical protein